MVKRIKVKNPERCIGCMSCVFSCARNRFKKVSLDDSAIKVVTAGGIESEFNVIACRACADPACVRACRTGALLPRDGGGNKFDPSKCNSCGECAKACLIGAITLDREKKPLTCTHCGWCAKFCPHDVLALETIEVF